jgi:hypothetical protein
MLIWDGKNIEEAYVKYYGGSGNLPGYPNMPAHVSKNFLPTALQTYISVYNEPNMYDNFHVIDDPYLNPFRFWDATLTVRMSCALAQTLNVNSTVRLITPYGAIVNARINTITANFGSREITFEVEF